jgi:hypothetical protein
MLNTELTGASNPRANVVRWCAWSGCGFIGLFFVGLLLIAGFVPLVAPALDGQEVVRIYLEHSVGIRVGVAVCMLGSVFMLAFGSALADQIRRIEDVPSALTLLQTASLASGVLIIELPLVCWGAAGMRTAQRNPDVTQALNDLGWLCFVGGVAPYISWALSTGVAILLDRSTSPVMPRWSGYFSVFVAFAQVPGAFVALFVTGPLAWNGLFAWWIPLTTFFSWSGCMIFLTIRATRCRLSSVQI